MFGFVSPNVGQILTATAIIAGFYVDSKLFWMVIYELKYSKGEEYLRGEFKRCR